MPRSARVRPPASTTFFLAVLDRCDRPTAASLRRSGVQPGRLAQGPDEKSGRAGRRFGFIILSLAEEQHSGGGAWPAPSLPHQAGGNIFFFVALGSRGINPYASSTEISG